VKSATWQRCSEVSINSELANLREIRTNLSECISTLHEDAVRTRLTMALSFVQMTIDALEGFKKERTTAAD